MQPGDLILDKYRVEELLGTGGMGRVLRVTHVVLQQQFALKILLPHMAESAETVSRFMREATATAQLKSEHTARVFDVGRMADGVPYMVMEYLAGNDLNQIIRHHGPQRSQITCDLMLQACVALAEAHSLGIVHRDIKPSNFYITTRPDGSMLLKILDFGISKTPVGVTELTGASAVIGTPTYMSPEQMKSGKAADARSDIWSMGIVMYQLLNGRPPYVGESYAELVIKVADDPVPPMHTQLPVGLSDVIHRCLDKDPNQRQQNVGELARMLAPYATDPVQGAQAATRATRILQHKGAPDANPLTANGGLSALVLPPPVAPRWAPTSPYSAQSGSSLSHGRGQVTHTHNVRGSRRGLIIGGVCALVLAAGAGGYFIAGGGGSGEPDTTHVSAPPAKDPIAAPTETKPAEAKPAETKPVETKPESADVKPESKPATADSKPVETKPVETKPVAETKPVETKPVETKPVETKPAVVTKTESKPAATVAKPVETKPAVTKTESKPTAAVAKPAVTKPATKPTTKKKTDDLFDNRH